MKAKYLTFISTVLALAATSSVVKAQSSSTQFKLSPQGTQLLCKEFPLNSRCTGSGTEPSASPSSTTAEPSASPSSTTAEPSPSPSSTTTEPGTNHPKRTTVPGSTTPPIGAPPGAGSQNKPYVTPQ